MDAFEHVLTPNIRVAIFREMKRALLERTIEKEDKYPNKLRWDEFVSFIAGATEGQDWFGLDIRVCGAGVPIGWDTWSERKATAEALFEWQPMIDPATGQLYYYSHVTGASLWDKTRETLRTEATLRRLIVSRLDNDIRGDELYLRNNMRSLRRDREKREAERRRQMRDRHLRIRREEGTAHRFLCCAACLCLSV